MQWVLDASIALAWCFNDEQTPVTEQLFERAASVPSVVPQIWALEMSNVLILTERKFRISPSQRALFIKRLGSLPIETDAETSKRAFSEISQLAQTHRLTVYDASYLELAMRLNIPLATLDQDLRKAAAVAGVVLL